MSEIGISLDFRQFSFVPFPDSLNFRHFFSEPKSWDFRQLGPKSPNVGNLNEFRFPTDEL